MDILAHLEYLLRIVVAMLCGAAIGYERESRLKTAGIRTHMIVSTAAALMMVVSKYGFYDVIATSGISLDPARIAAGVVTAVGFLGAGVIFVRKQNVSGVTTAAGIWATVGVGIAVGAGMYIVGVVTAGMILLLQFLLYHSTRLIKNTVTAQIVVRISEKEKGMELFQTIFDDRKIEILNMKAIKIDQGADGGDLEFKLTIKCPQKYKLYDLLQLLYEIPNIRSIET